MPKRASRTQPDLPPEFQELVDSMDLDQLRSAIPQLLELAGDRFMAEVRKRPDRRHPRAEPRTLVVRIDLVGAKPPIWRRVELPSTLMLDQLHDLLQLLFGWTDSHLHRFALGSSVWDRDADMFLCPYDVEEGEDEGIPANQVRLDETLTSSGDVLRYVYDYGDEWSLTIRLEKVMPGLPERTRVLAGKHEAPPDDSGGVWSCDDLPYPALDVSALDDAVAAWAR